MTIGLVGRGATGVAGARGAGAATGGGIDGPERRGAPNGAELGTGTTGAATPCTVGAEGEPLIGPEGTWRPRAGEPMTEPAEWMPLSGGGNGATGCASGVAAGDLIGFDAGCAVPMATEAGRAPGGWAAGRAPAIGVVVGAAVPCASSCRAADTPGAGCTGDDGEGMRPADG